MSSGPLVIPISRHVLADPPLGMRVQPLEPAVFSDRQSLKHQLRDQTISELGSTPANTRS